MRLFWLAFTLSSLLLAGCAAPSQHGPVSAGTLRRLQEHAISAQDFLSRLKGLDPQIRASLPRQPVLVPFEMKHGTPVILARGPGDRPLPMLLDSGAARVVLGARDALKAGVPTVDSKQAQATLLGVVGREQGLVGLISPLQIGTWRLPSYPCFVRTFEVSGEAAAHAANILGFDLVARYCSYLTLDYRAHAATFGFGSRFQPSASLRHSSAPFRFQQGVAFIDLTAKGKTWSSILDSGSFNGIEIDEAVARKLGVQDQGKIVEGLVLMAVGGVVSSEKARLRTVTLPSVSLLGGRYPDAEVDIAPGVPRVGSYFLKDYRVTFDFRARRVWLEW